MKKILIILLSIYLLVGCGQATEKPISTPTSTVKGTSTVMPTSTPKATQEITTKPTYTPKAEQSEKKTTTVYVTNSGKKYHKNGCQYLSKSKIAIDKDKAIGQGYEPCGKCGG